ncbi:hypothetical protein D9M68_798480 [compost metagenome]
MKKKVKNIMLGRAVRVPISLTVDPIGKQSLFGVITDADKKLDIISVLFEDGTTGNYQFNCLETLYPIKTLLHGISIRNSRFNSDDYRSIHKIISLAMQGQQMEALKLAYDKLVIAEFCVTTTDNFFEIKTNLKKYLGLGK